MLSDQNYIPGSRGRVIEQSDEVYSIAMKSGRNLSGSLESKSKRDGYDTYARS
jgi:hypothetical protein